MPKAQEQIPRSRPAGTLFDDLEEARRAAEKLAAEGVLESNIAIYTEFSRDDRAKSYRQAFKDSGYAEKDALYFDEKISLGRTLLSVSNVHQHQRASVIRILSENSSCDMRDDAAQVVSEAVFNSVL